MKDNMHTFELRQREGAKGVMHGANSELLIDGIKMMGVTEVNINVKAKELAVITIKVWGKFSSKGIFEAVQEDPTPPKRSDEDFDLMGYGR